MTALLIISLFMIPLLLFAFLAIMDVRNERTRKVRRHDFESAMRSINKIDATIDRYYPTVDLVGQAMCDEIRDVIKNHRKELMS